MYRKKRNFFYYKMLQNASLDTRTRTAFLTLTVKCNSIWLSNTDAIDIINLCLTVDTNWFLIILHLC